MKRSRILLGDDHVLILDGFRSLLEREHEIVGEATDGRSLVETAVRLKPDLVILDITMPLLNGIEAARQIKKELPRMKLVFVTMHANPMFLREAAAVGASGFVLKSSARKDLLLAVDRVLDGQAYVTPGFGGEATDLLPRHRELPLPAFRGLTAREREVLQLIAEGRSVKEMATILGVSVKTIAFHKLNIKDKLGIRTTAELTKEAIREGLTGEN